MMCNIWQKNDVTFLAKMKIWKEKAT